MTVEEAFRLIENLDYPEGLKRKFAPQFSLIHIARDGSIARVERYKVRTVEADQVELLKRFPGHIQILGKPGLYSSCGEFRQAVRDRMFLFDSMKPAPTENG